MDFTIAISGLAYYAPDSGKWAGAKRVEVFLPAASAPINIPGAQPLPPHVPLLVLPSANVNSSAGAPVGDLSIWPLGRRRVRMEAVLSAGGTPPLSIDLGTGPGSLSSILSMSEIDPDWAGLHADVRDDRKNGNLVASRLVLDTGDLAVDGLQPGVEHYAPGASGALGDANQSRPVAHRTALRFRGLSSLTLVLEPLDGSGAPTTIAVRDGGARLPLGSSNKPLAHLLISNLCGDSLLTWLGGVGERAPAPGDVDADFRRFYRLGNPTIPDAQLAVLPTPTVRQVSLATTGGVERPVCIPTCC